MNRVWDYTDDELLSLDDEQLATLINLECAHRGLPLLGKKPTAPEPLTAKPDLQCYTVEARTMHFTDKEAALRVAEFLNQQPRKETVSCIRGKWGPPYTLKLDETPVAVGSTTHWTQEHYEEHAKELKEYTTLKSAFDTEDKQYQEDEKKRQDVIEEVRERLSRIREERADQAAIRSRFAEYVELAGGDRQIALNFLLKASTRWSDAFIRATINPNEEEETSNGSQEGRTEEVDGFDEVI